MTRLPTESRDYQGLKGPDYPTYRVGPVCSVPGCSRLCDNAHHIVRRSELAGPYHWVRMPDGVEIGNVTGLCFDHHNQVTENKERIHYNQGQFFWSDGRMLTYQPPSRGTVEPEPEPTVPADAIIPGHDHDQRAKCPTCNRALPKPKIEGPVEEKKQRVSWAVGVPVTDREDGADTLDALLEAARDEMAKKGWEYGSVGTAKFFVLSHALSMFVLHADEILSDV